MKVVAKKRAFVNNTIFHFSTIFSHFGGGAFPVFLPGGGAYGCMLSTRIKI